MSSLLSLIPALLHLPPGWVLLASSHHPVSSVTSPTQGGSHPSLLPTSPALLGFTFASFPASAGPSLSPLLSGYSWLRPAPLRCLLHPDQHEPVNLCSQGIPHSAQSPSNFRSSTYRSWSALRKRGRICRKLLVRSSLGCDFVRLIELFSLRLRKPCWGANGNRGDWGGSESPWTPSAGKESLEEHGEEERGQEP